MTVRAHRRSDPTLTARAAALAEEAPAPEVRAAFDTRNHIDLGDQADGAPVVIRGIAFTPGEIAALVDFVGPPSALFRYSLADLRAIRAHLDAGGAALEDVAFWDPITDKYGDTYSERSQDNEDHFAPGEGGGPNFQRSFLGYYADGLRWMQASTEVDDDLRAEALQHRARASAYAAEHYLEDAFSAGHQVSAADLSARIDPLLQAPEALSDLVAAAGPLVFHRCRDELSKWQILSLEWNGYSTIDTLDEWMRVARMAQWSAGAEGVKDAVRKEIHERLAAQEAPLMVTCGLRSSPFPLGGDAAPSEESRAVLRDALQLARDLLEHPTPESPTRVAANVWERVRPRPTEETAGRVSELVTACTADAAALAGAMADGVARTLPEMMAAIEAESSGCYVRRRPSAAPPPPPAPPPPSREAPEADAPGPAPADSWVGRARDWAADDRDVPMVAGW